MMEKYWSKGFFSLLLLLMCLLNNSEKVYSASSGPIIQPQNEQSNTNQHEGGAVSNSQEMLRDRHRWLSRIYPATYLMGKCSKLKKKLRKRKKNRKPTINPNKRRLKIKKLLHKLEYLLKIKRKAKGEDENILSQPSSSSVEKVIKADETEKKAIAINERVADIPLLLGAMMKIDLHTILDRHIPGHWKQTRLSWGATCLIWLSYILSEGDHRKLVVQEYISTMKHTLSAILDKEIDELDFTDDRLAIVLKHLSNREYWKKIEHDLTARSIAAYELKTDVARCDATTVSGYHTVYEDGLFQFGKSKDNPKLPQLKMMVGALDPLGMPLASDIVSGEKADDILYIPVIDRIHRSLGKEGLLFVGDCKLGSFNNRLHIKGLKHHYLCPLPQTGKTAKAMGDWINQG